ncbi:MAG: 30S ribosomal protein S17 [Candidatus Aenigmarchaeota archaeon]|nr:30S ribosomal protein S17 [Candidatus Aenigmarchaeota archaeon]
MATEKTKKDIGIDAKRPRTACASEKCPWHGNLRVRGRIFHGVVASARAANSVVVEWNYYQKIQKYERYERRKTRITAHNPSCINAKRGDSVTIAECRPLSKSKHFVVIEKMI